MEEESSFCPPAPAAVLRALVLESADAARAVVGVEGARAGVWERGVDPADRLRLLTGETNATETAGMSVCSYGAFVGCKKPAPQRKKKQQVMTTRNKYEMLPVVQNHHGRGKGSSK